MSGVATYTATWARTAPGTLAVSGNGITRYFPVTPASRPDQAMLRGAGLLAAPGPGWEESDAEPGTWECCVFPASAALALDLAGLAEGRPNVNG